MLTYLRNKFYNQRAKKLIQEHAYEREKFEDRDVLERIIFPFVLAHFNPKKILDIGREDYQEFYNKFFIKRELWTMDINPANEEFGSIHHITDDVVNLKKYFRNDCFDFVLMNGVFGWGLDDEDKIQITFNAIYDILKSGKLFVLGYNDDIVPIEKIEGINKLKPYCFPPLKTDTFKCINGNHTYKFYIK